MAEELQSLIEKINRDGVEKATAEAERIVLAAKEQAAAIVKAAKDEATRHAAAAEADAKASAERAQETLRQAARDAVISVEGSVTRLLENILASNVDAALSDPATAATIAGEAVRDVVASGEISAAPKIAGALKAQLAAKANLTVVMDETHGTGFSVKLDGGRVEHDFTGATVAAELAKKLRPDLAALLR
jgi:V/A-type H+-transporting ATPase subunit E